MGVLRRSRYTKVYSVVDGFEGDLSAEGRRDVNGWRKAGLPWSYKPPRRSTPNRQGVQRNAQVRDAVLVGGWQPAGAHVDLDRRQDQRRYL